MMFFVYVFTLAINPLPKLVLKIGKCFSFKKYEVATNMLKLSRLSLKNERRILEFVFELKEVS